MTEEKGKRGAHAALRAVNGIAVLAMVLVVGGIGAEYMNEGNIAVGLLLQIPLYALVGFCWGVFARSEWAAKIFVPAFGAGTVFTVVLYLVRHAEHAREQLDVWLRSFSGSEANAATVLFGQPAIIWLVVLFVVAPAAAWLKCRADGGGKLGQYLLGDTNDDVRDASEDRRKTA